MGAATAAAAAEEKWRRSSAVAGKLVFPFTTVAAVQLYQQFITLWYYRVPLRHDCRAPVNTHALHRYSGKSKCRRRTGKPDRSAAAAEWGRHPTLAAPLRARVQ